MTEDWDKLVAALDTLDEDGDKGHFDATRISSSIINLTLLETATSFKEVEIVLRSNGTYEVMTTLSKIQTIFKTLRNRWSCFNDWDDSDLEQLLDELDVKY